MYEALLSLITMMVLLGLLAQAGHIWKPLEVLLKGAFLLGILSLLSYWIASRTAIGWLKLVSIPGAIISRVILSVLFFCILFPISIIYRLMGNDNLKLRKKQRDSFYDKREHQYEANDLKNIW